MTRLSVLLMGFFMALVCFCTGPAESGKIRVLLDTDANNELDDQHAIAYLLLNGDVFDVEGITVNRTNNGGDVEEQAKEAERVVQLCGQFPQIKVKRGANGSFEEIKDRVKETEFDGDDAVNLIIQKAHEKSGQKLVLLPVGKLTNIALALEKDPDIIPKVKVVWLGSNYPDPGEYNQDNDVGAMNYILDTEVEFEIVTVRYGKSSGTSAVTASLAEIQSRMPGLGPKVSEPVVGRHGGEHLSFGDYSVALFGHIQLYGDHKVRSLFDMAAVAIVKNPAWAERVQIPAPILVNGQWQDRPDNQRKIGLWENFDRESIMTDFYETMENPVLAGVSD